MTRSTALLTGLFMALGAAKALAVPPGWRGDRELLERASIVVVARWLPREGEEVDSGLHRETEILVERVLRGAVAPGRHSLRVAKFAGVGFSESYPWILAPLTVCFGDVRDVTVPSLWFLTLSSGESGDGEPTLEIDHYRCVQPLELEPYFRALESDDPADAIAALLGSGRPALEFRCMDFLCGGWRPWPYEYDPFVGPREKGASYPGHRDAIRKVLAGAFDEEVRAYAAAAFADLATREDVGRLEGLLEDPSPEVRLAALGGLVRLRATDSWKAIDRAVPPLAHSLHLAYFALWRLTEWNIEEIVPTLIRFLQTDARGRLDFADPRDAPPLLVMMDNCSIRVEDTEYARWQAQGPAENLPAWVARRKLRSLTGYLFPFDVEASLEAWEKAARIEDPERRLEFLRRELPAVERPFEARAEQKGDEIEMVVTNRSDARVSLARRPSEVAGSGPFQYVSLPYESPELTGRESFVELRPGESVRFSIPRPHGGKPALRIDLDYERNGNEIGVNAWIGRIVASWPSK